MSWCAKNGYCSVSENLTGAQGQEQGFVGSILHGAALPLAGEFISSEEQFQQLKVGVKNMFINV